ncbi:MAG: glutamine synthetase type III, partial [Lachnospiraceae bacterium]|nr:glutamine synthetase type III [Lachnospiraceae bacterium]
DTSVQEGILKDIATELKTMIAAVDKLEKLDEKALDLEDDMEKAARCFHDEVFAAMEEVRTPADKLEELVDKKYWPVPQYEDLLFYV